MAATWISPAHEESTRPRRLIEDYFPSATLSDQGVSERYQRGKTPHTIFTWWARRPFSAMRGVIAAALTRSGGTPEECEVVDAYCSTSERTLITDAMKHVSEAKSQRVLDVFAGGATIPIEAAALGAQAYAVDNNELAHFIQVVLLQLSQVSDQLPQLVEKHGRELLTRLKDETEHLFPNRAADRGLRTVAYMWSRSTNCPECKAPLSLLKRPWLSNKNGETVFLKRKAQLSVRKFTVEIDTHGLPRRESNAWDGTSILCPFCEHKVPRTSVESVLTTHAFDELLACCATAGNGKTFRVASSTDIPDAKDLESEIQADLNKIGKTLPNSELPRWSGITNPTLYGLRCFADLFNLRQRAVLVKACRLLQEQHCELASHYGPDVAKAITACLSGFIDQLADWNCRLCMWISQNEQVGRGLSGPGIPMMWDFVEIDPVEHGPANLWDKLDRIVAGLAAIPNFLHLPTVVKGDSRALPFADEFFDVVATDPPYFDNIYYNVLADCIYVWKRFALIDIFPTLFAAPTTNEKQELSASKYRQGSKEQAAKFYTNGMTKVLAEVHRVLKPDGILAFVFAHRTVDGWASVVDSFRNASMDLVAAWEMQVERKHRPRGMRSDAVNTSFVLVGKKRSSVENEVQWQSLRADIDAHLRNEHVRLLREDYSPEDVARSMFGIAVCRFAHANKVFEDEKTLDTLEVLRRIGDRVRELIPEFQLDER